MISLKLQPNGKALALAIPAFSLLYLVFLDLIMLILALASVYILLASFISAVRRARWLSDRCEVKPAELSLKLVAGSTGSVKIMIRAPKRSFIELDHPLKFCDAKQKPCLTNEDIELNFSPILAGNYSSDHVKVSFLSPLRIFKVSLDLPLRVEVVVLPRVVPLAVMALRLAVSVGHVAREVPLQLIGRGTEYAETREYLPGDDLRRVDWKATARMRKLMIKQFHEEAGGPVNLVFDAKAPGPVSKDRAAAHFLSLTLATFRRGVPMAITRVSERGALEIFKFRDPKLALLKAVDIALNAAEVDYTYLYDFLDPHSLSEVLALIKAVSGQDGSFHLKFKNVRKFGEIEVVSCLTGDLTWLMSLHETIRGGEGKLRVYVPSGAWIDSPTLEQAYLDYEKQLKIVASLMRRGIKVKLVREDKHSIGKLGEYP